MSKLFINLSNHPSNKWSFAQMAAAQVYGKVIDISFPDVPAEATEEDIQEMADQCMGSLDGVMAANHCSIGEVVAMVQGEFTLTYALVTRLKEKKVPVLAACSRRDTVEIASGDGETIKTSKFTFVQFRKY